MRRVLRRQVLAYLAGLATALAGFTVGAAWAGKSADSNTIAACADKSGGDLYLLSATKTGACKKGDSLVQWSITGPRGPQGEVGPQGPAGPAGPQGPAGSFTKAKSPNGLYTATLGNNGITISGPAGSLVVNRNGAQIITIQGTP
jgi:hypothetical protein